MNEITFDFACRDDCLELLVPSDLRKLVSERDALKGKLKEYEEKICNCRWDGEIQVAQCELHEAHVDAIHEWAERAKVAGQRLAAAESELNKLRCALNDEKVSMGVLHAFWRRVFGAANFTAFDMKVLTAHMLTALSGVDVFSRCELAETSCPDCGPVSVNPDVFNNGIPVSGICPYCKDRLHFEPQTMSGEV